MKKYLSLFIVLVMIFTISFQAAQAETIPATNAGASVNANLSAEARLKAQADLKAKRDAMMADLKGKRAEVKTEIQTQREAMRTKIQAMRMDAKTRMSAWRESFKTEKDAARVKIKEARLNLREMALKRFDAAMARMTGLKGRINTHISNLEVKGVNVDDAKKFMATAETKLDAADAKTAEINALLAVSIDELGADNKAKLKTLAGEIQTLIKDAHLAMISAVKSLKDSVKIKMETKAAVNKDVKASTSTEAVR